jgi:hypothetical protein
MRLEFDKKKPKLNLSKKSFNNMFNNIKIRFNDENDYIKQRKLQYCIIDKNYVCIKRDNIKKEYYNINIIYDDIDYILIINNNYIKFNDFCDYIIAKNNLI